MNKQPTYRGQWVSVKERLPVERIRVSVIYEGKIEQRLFDEEFYISPAIRGNRNITHWLELYLLPPLPQNI